MVKIDSLQNFLKNPQIQELLEHDNLDKIYIELLKENISPAKFTKFLLDKAQIQPLDYMQSVAFFMYYGLGITEIDIPHNIKSIGNSAFSYCDRLTSVTIGNNVTSIDNSAFLNCNSLTSVNIPNSVTSIGYAAFCGCSSLKSITIGSGVTSIGYKAFYGCSKLVMKCYKNSVAHKYAVDNNIKYELI